MPEEANKMENSIDQTVIVKSPEIHPLIWEAWRVQGSPVKSIPERTAEYYVNLFRAQFPSIAQASGNRLAAAVRIMTRPGACQPGEYPGIFLVQSEHNKLGYYTVNLVRKTCGCPDHPGVTAKGGMCKHRIAIGCFIFGPEWVRFDQVRQVQQTPHLSTPAEDVERHRKENAFYFAQHDTENAWKESSLAVDQWEFLAEKLGSNDPQVEAARENMLALLRRAEELNKISNALYSAR